MNLTSLSVTELCALLTQIIADADTRDSTLSPQPVSDYPKEMKKDLKSM